jgi:hypothetical protein
MLHRWCPADRKVPGQLGVCAGGNRRCGGGTAPGGRAGGGAALVAGKISAKRQFGPTYLGRDALPRVRLFRATGGAGGFGLGTPASEVLMGLADLLLGVLAVPGWVHDVRLQDADLEDVADGQINERLPADVNVFPSLLCPFGEAGEVEG